jgi:hypothetical protein
VIYQVAMADLILLRTWLTGTISGLDEKGIPHAIKEKA